MKCSCGFDNGQDARFCGKCGLPLGPGDNTPNSTAPPTPLAAVAVHRADWGSASKANIKSALVIVTLLVLWGVYYFLLRHDPVRDGERAAAESCRCASDDNARRAEVTKKYLLSFDGKRFKRREAARDALAAMLTPANVEAEQCRVRAQATLEKLKERYLANREEVGKFQYALDARRNGCVDANVAVLQELNRQLFAKYETIPDLEAEVNAVLANQYGAKYRVVADKDRGWDKYEFEHFVLPNRKTFEYYPYIVKGDFDGDKVADLAAEVVNTENNYHRLAFVWGGDKRLTFYDGQLCSAISFLPANEWKSHWEAVAVHLEADAILVECYEKSAWILYWDGRAFQQYWMSD